MMIEVKAMIVTCYLKTYITNTLNFKTEQKIYKSNETVSKKKQNILMQVKLEKKQ